MATPQSLNAPRPTNGQYAAPAAVAQPTSQQVGEQFVTQYYHVKHHNPKYLYRFYNDASRVTVVDAQDPRGGPSHCVTASGQAEISTYFENANFQHGKTYIESTQSQDSQNNGVIVVVTGTVELLEKGFFVLNDIFKYIHGGVPAVDSAESQREGHWPLQTHQAHTQQNGVIQPTSLHDNVARPPPATLPAPAPAPVVAPPQGDANPVVPAVAQYQQSVAKTHRPAEMNGAAAHVAPPVPDSAASVHTVVSAPRPQETQVPLDVPRSVPSDVPPPVVRPNSRRPESGSGPAQSTIPQRDSSVETPSPVPTADDGGSRPAAPASSPPRETPAPQVVLEDVAVKPVKAPEKVEPAAPVQNAAPVAKPPPEPEKATKAKTWAEIATSQPKATPPAPKPVAPESAPVGPTPAAKAPVRSAAPVTAPPPAPSTSGPPTNGFRANGGGRNNDQEEEASIFVNHIPENVDVQRLEEIFSVFGVIKNGGKAIKLKPQRGKDNYAFIDYESPSAVEKALASPPLLGDKQLSVSKKRPQYPTGYPTGYPSRGGRGHPGPFRGNGRGGRGGAPPDVNIGQENGNGNHDVVEANVRHPSVEHDNNGPRPAADAPLDGNGSNGRPKVMGRNGDGNGFYGRGRGGRGGRGGRRGDGRGIGPIQRVVAPVTAS